MDGFWMPWCVRRGVCVGGGVAQVRTLDPLVDCGDPRGDTHAPRGDCGGDGARLACSRGQGGGGERGGEGIEGAGEGRGVAQVHQSEVHGHTICEEGGAGDAEPAAHVLGADCVGVALGSLREGSMRRWLWRLRKYVHRGRQCESANFSVSSARGARKKRTL